MTDARTIPTEQLLAQVDDPTRPGIYALELGEHEGTLKDHIERWQDAGYEEPPTEHLPAVAACNRLLYVGAAGGERGLLSRLETHVHGGPKQAKWSKIYPPVELVRVWLSPNADHAFDHERQTAYHTVRATDDGTAVVCDGEVVG
jgi:predicted GIY-YIG superfamily endonuclease